MNKIKALVLTLMVFLSFKVEAQSTSNKANIGFNINQFQKDFGLGLHLTSPYFVKSTVAIRGGANFQWFENFNGTETTWTTYQNFQLGIRGRNIIVSDKMFIYGEGGVIAILPNSEFSSKSTEFGGYGLFGFEFIFNVNFAYFIELGGVGTGAKADKIIGSPIYSNGFLTTVGFRMGI